MKIQSDNVDEIRKILLANGVQSFRLQAGFIPKNAPEDECSIFPEATDAGCQWYYATMLDGETDVFVHELILDNDIVVYEIHAVCINVRCCFGCTQVYQKLVGDAFILWCDIYDEFCPMCGKYEDGLPF